MNRWSVVVVFSALAAFPAGGRAQSVSVSAGPARWFSYGGSARPDGADGSWGLFTRVSVRPSRSNLHGAVSLGYAAQQEIRPGMWSVTVDLGTYIPVLPSWRLPPRIDIYGGAGLQRFSATNWEAVVDACHQHPTCLIEGPGGWQTGTRAVLAAGAALEIPISAMIFGRMFLEARSRIGSGRAGPENRILPAFGVGLGLGIP